MPPLLGLSLLGHMAALESSLCSSSQEALFCGDAPAAAAAAAAAASISGAAKRLLLLLLLPF
jgi:hypothetical protein